MKKRYIMAVVLALLSVAIYNAIIKQNDLNLNGVDGIAKIVDVKVSNFRNSTTDRTIYFQYEIDGKSYSNSVDTGAKKAKIGDCYRIEYSSKNPEVVKMYFGDKVECSSN